MSNKRDEEKRKRREKEARELKKQLEKRKDSYRKISDEREKFMFVYEDEEGKIYNKLSSIEKKTSLNSFKVNIFPVYMTKHNPNLIGETIEWVDNNWKSSLEDDESWLKIINSKDDKIKIKTYNRKDIIVYNDKLFRDIDDLIYYLKHFDAEYLPVF